MVTILVTQRLAGDSLAMGERSDAAFTPYALTKSKSRSSNVQMMSHELLKEEHFICARRKILQCSI